MDKKRIFNTIIDVFKKSFANYYTDKIINEYDWEKQLYCLFREEFKSEIYSNYYLLVEDRFGKSDGKKVLWMTPNSYQKKKRLIDDYFEVEYDKVGHIKLDMTRPKKHLDSKINKLISDEKKRPAYVDLALEDVNNRRIFLIELKIGNNLQPKKVEDDYYKLIRVSQAKEPDAIYIAVGFDPLNKKVYWKPTSKEYNYNFNLSAIKPYPRQTESLIKELTDKKLESIIKNTTKELFENYIYATEAHLVSEIIYQLSKILPAEWYSHREIGNLFFSKREKLDLGVYYKNKLKFAVELKGHYEGGLPPELRSHMANDKELEKEFIIKAKLFFEKYNLEKSIKKSLSSYPKRDGTYFLNSDFFDKIIEIYNQCKRMSQLVKEGVIEKGFMAFVDHQDNFNSKKNTLGFTESEFLNNFNYRKYLIEKLISPYLNECKFIYLYGLNRKNVKGKIEKSIYITE